MIASGACLFGYVLNMHASSPHDEAVTHKEIQAVEERLSRHEARYEQAMQRIEQKLDKALSK